MATMVGNEILQEDEKTEDWMIFLVSSFFPLRSPLRPMSTWWEGGLLGMAVDDGLRSLTS